MVSWNLEGKEKRILKHILKLFSCSQSVVLCFLFIKAGRGVIGKREINNVLEGAKSEINSSVSFGKRQHIPKVTKK